MSEVGSAREQVAGLVRELLHALEPVSEGMLDAGSRAAERATVKINGKGRRVLIDEATEGELLSRIWAAMLAAKLEDLA